MHNAASVIPARHCDAPDPDPWPAGRDHDSTPATNRPIPASWTDPWQQQPTDAKEPW